MAEILLVDAAPYARRIASQILKAHGYTVDLASDGLIALERVKEKLPALIITEILLPRLDGLELVATLRQENRKFPILVLSSLDDEQRSLANGATLFMRKPIEKARLVSAVQSLLTGKSTI